MAPPLIGGLRLPLDDWMHRNHWLKPVATQVDVIAMGANARGFAWRVYRIKPWPVRIGVPFMVVVVILGLGHDGALVAVPIPNATQGVAWRDGRFGRRRQGSGHRRSWPSE